MRQGGGELVINTQSVSVVLWETWRPTPFITVWLLLSGANPTEAVNLMQCLQLMHGMYGENTHS